MIFTIPLPGGWGAELAAELEYMGASVSPAIKRLRVNAERTAVEVEGGEGATQDELREKLTRFAQSMLSNFESHADRSTGPHAAERDRLLKERVVAGARWVDAANELMKARPDLFPEEKAAPRRVAFQHERRDRGPLVAGVFEELRRRGWVADHGRGHVSLAGPALALHRVIDGTWARLGRERFGAQERSYPSLLPMDVLVRIGFFTSFPNMLWLSSRLVEEPQLLDHFRKANLNQTRLVFPKGEVLQPPVECLNPSVCWHLYPTLEGQTVASPGQVVTAATPCFRHEPLIVGAPPSLERLQEFTMREIIFAGADEWVARERQAAMQAVSAQLVEWDLSCTFEPANDLFFATAFAAMDIFDLRSDLKYEMCLGVEPGPGGEPRSVAAGSFNLHMNLMGKTFGFQTGGGQAAFTGCTAFGIERWVLAAFTQHGLEPGRWPAALRAEIFS